MLGKLRLKPSLLLEVAFILAVWLVAWKVLDASLIVTVTAIFGAYVLVFVYENWLAGLARRERSEQRRTRREEATWYEKADSSPLSKSPSTSSVSKVGATTANATNVAVTDDNCPWWEGFAPPERKKESESRARSTMNWVRL